MTKSQFVTRFIADHPEIDDTRRLSAANKAWRDEKARQGTDAVQRADREKIIARFEEGRMSREEFDALIASQPESVQRNKNWWEKIWLMTDRLHAKVEARKAA